MNFKKYFNSLRIVQKIEVYLIILIFYGFIFIYHQDIIEFFINQEVQETTQSDIITKSSKLKNTKVSFITDLELVTYMTKQSKNRDIVIGEYRLYKNHVELKIDGDFNSLVNLLLEIQNYFHIISFEITENNDGLTLTIVVKKNYFYNDDTPIITKQRVENLFESEKNTPVVLRDEIKIMAIVAKEVLIEGIWYKQNDVIDRYRVVNINKESIELFDIQKKQKILKVLSYE